MGDPNGPLLETVTRIHQLLEQRNLSANQYLDHKQLSHDTGISVETVAALLAGKRTAESRETDTGEIARRRFRFLQETRLAPNGEPYTPREIAEAIGVSKQWVHLLLGKGQKKVPSLELAKPLANFFGQEITFLTDTAPEALNKRLTRITLELSGNSDPMERLIQEFGLQGISARSTNLRDHQKQIIAGMIIGMISSNDAEGR